MTRDAASRWFRNPVAGGPEAQVLYCFPYAGAGASVFFPWARELAPSVEVSALVLPGREARLAEPPVERLEPLVATLADLVEAGAAGRRFAFFGHSLGAVIAYELTRELLRRGAALPGLLIVSARGAPHLPEPRPPMRHLSRDAFLAEAQRRFGGIPAAILNEPELLDLLLPALRADIALLETYEPRPPDPLPLPVPILALSGRDDTMVSAASVDAWRPLTQRSFERRILPGGHFFLQGARREVLEVIREALASLPRSGVDGRCSSDAR